MSCLEATFTLTPKSPFYWDTVDKRASLYCYGADFWAGSTDFSSLYVSNQFFFDDHFAADPNLDYTQWANLKRTQYLNCFIDLNAYAAANKQLALIFGFDVLLSGFDGHVLVYSNAGLLQDQKLMYGDNQFLLEIESLDLPLYLFFIHAGGFWFFNGLSGYVV